MKSSLQNKLQRIIPIAGLIFVFGVMLFGAYIASQIQQPQPEQPEQPLKTAERYKITPEIIVDLRGMEPTEERYIERAITRDVLCVPPDEEGVLRVEGIRVHTTSYWVPSWFGAFWIKIPDFAYIPLIEMGPDEQHYIEFTDLAVIHPGECLKIGLKYVLTSKVPASYDEKAIAEIRFYEADKGDLGGTKLILEVQ